MTSPGRRLATSNCQTDWLAFFFRRACPLVRFSFALLLTFRITSSPHMRPCLHAYADVALLEPQIDIPCVSVVSRPHFGIRLAQPSASLILPSLGIRLVDTARRGTF